VPHESHISNCTKYLLSQVVVFTRQYSSNYRNILRKE